MKEKFLELLKTVNREGINDLIDFIEKTDFFNKSVFFISIVI